MAEKFESLIRDLQLENPPARAESAAALGQSGENRALEALLSALDDPDWRVRAAAGRSLGQLGAQAARAVPELWQQLQAESEEPVKRVCQEALRQIEAALQTAPAELESAIAPAGTGSELEAGSAPGSK